MAIRNNEPLLISDHSVRTWLVACLKFHGNVVAACKYGERYVTDVLISTYTRSCVHGRDPTDRNSFNECSMQGNFCRCLALATCARQRCRKFWWLGYATRSLAMGIFVLEDFGFRGWCNRYQIQATSCLGRD